jgi:AbrB family looped-hinge helix DNA binding protein
MAKKYNHGDFYGTTILGEKGQIVVPAAARIAMKIKKGERLLVFGLSNDMLVMSKLSNLRKIVGRMTTRLEVLRRVVKTTKSK